MSSVVVVYLLPDGRADLFVCGGDGRADSTPHRSSLMAGRDDLPSCQLWQTLFILVALIVADHGHNFKGKPHNAMGAYLAEAQV